MPRPVRRILSPFLRWRVVSVTKSPSMASACFFGRSWLSDKAAAKMLEGDGSLRRSLRRGGGFLCSRGCFLRWRHDDLTWAALRRRNLLVLLRFEPLHADWTIRRRNLVKPSRKPLVGSISESDP